MVQTLQMSFDVVRGAASDEVRVTQRGGGTMAV